MNLTFEHLRIVALLGVLIILISPQAEAQMPAPERVGKEVSKAPTAGDAPLARVVAEGVGSSAEEAIKDAFRNAVRQVVGAVVDAETLIKNDELIDDKVLTYSGGFIKSYEEVPGSKKIQGGLHRTKIIATVERRSVVAKLKSANVTIDEVDGKGLFAEAVTQLEAEDDAVKLIRKQLEGFPQSCISASIAGRPEILGKTTDSAKIQYTVKLEPNLVSYKAFAAGMERTLEKLGKPGGEFTATFQPQTEGESYKYYYAVEKGFGAADIDTLSAWLPKLLSRSPARRNVGDTIGVGIGSSRSKAGDRLEFRYFLFDQAVRSELVAVASRESTIKVTFHGANNEVIAVERFPAIERTPIDTGACNATLISSFGFANGEWLYALDLSEVVRRNEAFIFLFSPTFFFSGTNRLQHRTGLHITRTLELSLDELKAIKRVSCEFKSGE